ncbi:TPA: methyltransferase domain-containing protein [Pluralibacter gergoviae]|nr:methyltransferase domain-containing protein [Pluralibacter gergoviae]HDS1239679.1 methyltransferase domain-containing protein [Pluralibacter gergoviae]HDS1245400.1 methyltransferase domain-containing protein [Pluralibacter gergoviae]HDS1250938.1 methyltransferase domain-containing protein [Pluralibacter gergoviae]HDS1256194.1 methyltransferase domain-containing protein [Pluralibacter gergoviae]
MTLQNQTITSLVEQLPEVYQPIFKHPDFSALASRSCHDRLEKIASIYNYISQTKGRPLKVLDLGCAQGFFSLSLAELGATVTAVDYSQPNINICRALAAENNQLNIEFLLGSIETIVADDIGQNEYDLVLGLSVFHHLIYEHGMDFVLKLFNTISQKIETGIFEFALNSEPLYWAASQPNEPRELIETFTFSHHLASYGTHLSEIQRPFYFASNKYWSIEGNYGVIDDYMQRSHQLDNFYHGNNRRYYFSENKIVKIFLGKDDTNNYSELLNESKFLQRPIPDFRKAQLISYGFDASESWLVRTQISGRLLLDIILSGDDYDDEKIIAGILEQVTILERNALYHNDLRSWNILIGDDDKVYLIDYGSISAATTDGDDLYGQILSFLILIKEVAQHRIREQGSQRPNFISTYDFPEKYRNWVNKIWNLTSQDWTFSNITAAYNDNNHVSVDAHIPAVLESYLSIVSNHMNWQFKQLHNDVNKISLQLTNDFLQHDKMQKERFFSELNKKVEILENLNLNVEKITSKVEDFISEQKGFSENENTVHNSELLAEINNYKEIFANLRSEIDLVYASKSWRITYPLRMLSKTIKSLVRSRDTGEGINDGTKKKNKIISTANAFFNKHPRLRQKVLRLLNKYPHLKYKVKQRLIQSNNNVHFIKNTSVMHSSDSHVPTIKQERIVTVRREGMHEEQKSVLESWFH